ncbi:hybrid sensor histidine kinase/response regulator [Azohydromonas australica]|uniref:hybrid sensor histidine kinase/response regulator n=1 Tax=Azohydromonas australica TaxID=364039 RepID=UPI000684CDF1|nr:ATP-binding protein [Azohydromonas australica]
MSASEIPFDENLDAQAPAPSAALVWHTNAVGAIEVENPSWSAFTGQDFLHYRGWGWTEAVHADDRPEVLRRWQTAVASGDVFLLHYRLRRRDGEYREVMAQGAPVLAADGVVREWVGTCVDVTAERRAQAALRASEERLRFLDSIGQATRALTDATEIMAVTARMLGEHLGATRCAYADVEPDNDRFTIRSDWSRPGVPSSAGVYSLDLFGPQATSNLRRGRHLVVNDVDRELGDDGGGRMFNAIGIKAIICAGLVKEGRLVAMMAVHQAHPRRWTPLEISVAAEVVDRSWAHIERVRAAALLREQDRHKDEFLATLAHELRNPLAPIKYAIALLRLSIDPARQAQAHNIIDRQTSHMARLIDDLLDVSRISRGLITLQREQVPLRRLMLEAVETARPAIESARHRLTLQLPDEGVLLDADPARIVQVIGNLLTNAAKYTPDGGEIRLAGWAAGARAVVEVVDNGVGVPPEQQGRLFQMFTQLHHSAGRAKGGLGIGLSLVRKLTEMHGGSVRMHSDGLDEGSTFSIELPLAQQAAPVAGGPQGLPLQTLPQGAEGLESAPRVLVVEDNPDGLQMLVSLLQALGLRVAWAADGAEALRQAQAFRPQLVLLDLGLPGLDGYEVARRLRADPGHAGTALVALTGWGAESDRRRTAEAGFDAHLTKPVEPDALRAVLGHFARVAG